jgi:predicted enzyme related to lactoylglutathione lyase
VKDLHATRREALGALAGASALALAGEAFARDAEPPAEAAPANPLGVHFGFTKLVVGDLERSVAFYRAVCGVVETGRVDAEIAGRKISEVLFAPTAAGGATLVLLAFHDAPKPATGEVILGVVVADADAFVARAVAAGGTVVEAVHAMPELKIRVGFVADVEGHWIEVVQQDA